MGRGGRESDEVWQMKLLKQSLPCLAPVGLCLVDRGQDLQVKIQLREQESNSTNRLKWQI